MANYKKLTIAILFLLFSWCDASNAATFIKLKSTSTGTLPFTSGLAFKKGDVASAPTLDITNYQVVVKKLWNDGSVKHAVVSGYADMVSGVEKTINVSYSGTQPTGTTLTASDIAAAAPTASIQCGSIGTVTLSSLLATPARTWISGPEMVEAHYQSIVGSSPSLIARFHVKLYRGGEIYIRAIVDNGVFNYTTSDISYVPTITIGGVVAYNNSGSALVHQEYSRYHAEGWIGITNPNITIKHDTDYLTQSYLVPNYWKKNPSSTTLNAMNQTYTPMTQGAWKTSMADTGYSPGIGLLPKWDALYVSSGGDERAYKSVLANAAALNYYPIIRKDINTLEDIDITAWGIWTVMGSGGEGTNTLDNGVVSWNDSHHGSAGYLAYLITGDYFYLDVLKDQASLCYTTEWAGHGSGVNRIFIGQSRGAAWKGRTVSQYLALAPPDTYTANFATLLQNNMAYWSDIIVNLPSPGIGAFYEYTFYGASEWGTGAIATWQTNFWVASLGHGSSIEPLATMTTYNSVRDYSYRWVAGLTGDSSGYCFTRAANYAVTVSPTEDLDPSTWYTSWADVYENSLEHYVSFGSDPCENTLLGTLSSTPSSAPQMGMWGELLPALAYAVNDGATGALAGLNRIKGATNYSTLENSGFDDDPQWGIVPLTETPPPPDPTCSDGVMNGDETGVDCGGSCSACSGSGLTNSHVTRKAGNTAATRRSGNTPVTIQ